jgi:hypothetical protein
VPDVVDRDDTPVEFIACADEIDAIRDAWGRLEAVVPLRGNHFYGTFDGRQYRACVECRGASWGLERGTIPGGRYARARLRGEPPTVYELISPTVEGLEGQVDVDTARPVIEHYRRHDEIDVLVPVA